MPGSPDADRLILRPLRADDEEQVLAAHAELAAERFEFLFGPDDASFADRIRDLEHSRIGEGLAPSRVPATFLGAFVGNDLVGRSSIRHALSDRLMREGGHIGYGVRPGFRRRGFATAILRHSLKRASELGIDSALVTCDAANLGSKTVIERCGGELDENEEWRMPGKLRYWVPTAARR